MAPAAGFVVVPWDRSSEPGNKLGGTKFDMDRWNRAYFERFRSFVDAAAKRNIIVEVTFFSSTYNEGTWTYCPVNPANNIKGTLWSNLILILPEMDYL